MWDLGQYGEREALLDDKGRTITYRKLEREGEKLAKQIDGRVLVFSMCTNSIGSILGYVSFLNYNIVPILLNARMDREQLYKLMETYQPAYIWAPSDHIENMSHNAEDAESAFSIYYGCKKVYEAEDYILLETVYPKRVALYRELGLLLTTSGSTGSPKLVRQSYNNIRVNAESIVKYLELSAIERPITTLPMHYTYGLSIINSHLLVGASILLTEKSVLQKEFWELFKEFEVTSFSGVPYTYEMLDKLKFYQMELPSLRYMTQAGGKLLSELHRKFAEYAIKNNRKFVVMYGQCEATARMSYLPADKALEKCGSMGIAIPGGRLYLIDTEGHEISEANKVGELVYEGANVTLGYAENREELIKGDERNGRLFTGDMARKDEEGYYYIVGRKKRFLKLYGNRVNLDEIDMMLKDEFKEVECVCGGVDDHICVYVTSDGYEEKMRQFLTQKMKLNRAAFSIKKVGIIPKTDSGKIKYDDLGK